ncbi:MAG: hypothetical protein OHK0029_34410 [Armatimonadaceae bacterium]
MTTTQLYRWNLTLTACAYLLAVPAAAQDTPQPEAEAPTPKPARRFSLKVGPEYSIYRLGGSRAASVFGNQWTVLGLGLGRLEKIDSGLTFQPEVTFLFGRSGDNNATLIPVQAGARYGIRLGRDVSAYAGLSAGYSGVNLKSEANNIRSGWRFAPSGSGVVGINLNRRVYTEVRYYRFAPVNGFNLSGTSFGVGIRF